MKIAQFRELNYDYVSVFAWRDGESEERANNWPGYVRISEWIDVDFTGRPSAEVIPAQLAVLDKAEIELRDKFSKALHTIAEQRAKLKCLTHDAPVRATVERRQGLDS